MAKNMARIEDGIVTNIEWCSDRTEDTDVLISIYDRPVAVNDIYDGQDFYHNGQKILTPMEELEKENEEYKSSLKIMGVVFE